VLCSVCQVVGDLVEFCQDKITLIEQLSAGGGAQDASRDKHVDFEGILSKLKVYIEERTTEAAAVNQIISAGGNGRQSAADVATVARAELRQAWIELCGQKACHEAELKAAVAHGAAETSHIFRT
jgi:hypothetical protein